MSQRAGRQLEHRARPAVRDDPARRHPKPDGANPAVTVEEDEVEREAHAEGVHAGAAGNQQAGPRRLTVEAGQAEQASAGRRRNGDAASEDRCRGKPVQASRGHLSSRRARAILSPASAKAVSAVVAWRHAATMTGMIQHLPSPGLRRWIGFNSMNKKTTRRGNYESGSDYVLEYGELRFAFNEEDFGQRVEQAAVKLGFVQQGLSREELDDLLDLAVNGEISEPSSLLGEHINENWEDLVGPANRSLVHWLRRLVFRGAWLDQRVKEGELDVVFDERTQTFGYVQPDRSSELIELSKEPSWRRIAYRR
jgi:hypothetical protein